MLIGHKTPTILAAEVEMHRQAHPGAFLLVEGNDDLRFWKSRCHPQCRLVRGEGKANVVDGVGRLDLRGFKGALGLVDSDYDTFTGGGLASPNLVSTDAHDLECLLCRSMALDKVLDEHGDELKIARFEDEAGTDVRRALLNRALVFGRVRLAATLWAAPEAMQVIRVPRFVDEERWVVDTESLIGAVADRSRQNRRSWEARTEELLQEDPWFVVRGHDMVEILRIGLKNVLGNTRSKITARDIAQDLRLAMSRAWLEETGLWTEIRFWEDGNEPYAIVED